MLRPWMQHYQKQRDEIEKSIETLLPEFHCTLMTMPGIDMVTAANMLAEIGNIERFPNAKKLARFAGIAPVNFSSAGKGKDVCPKQGNRRLQALFYFLAIQMVQVSPGGVPRNPAFREYFLKKLKEGKISSGDLAIALGITPQALSYHLSKLKKADLIYETKYKNFIYYELNLSVLDEAVLWINDLRGGQ